MIQVSNNLIETIKSRSNFIISAKLTQVNTAGSSDGMESSGGGAWMINIPPEHISMSGNSFTVGAGTSSFPAGVALSRQITISILNYDGVYNVYSFNGASLTLRVKLIDDDEFITFDNYTVVSDTYGDIIKLTAQDSMHKADVALEFSGTSAQEISVEDLYRVACQKAGLTGEPLTVLPDNVRKFKLNRPATTTCRNALGCVALFAGGYAYINDAQHVEIKRWTQLRVTPDAIGHDTLDGGLLSPLRPWGDTADGGTFSPISVGDVYDGMLSIDSLKENNINILDNWISLNVEETRAILITGVAIGDYTYGNEGYQLKLYNSILSGKEEEAVALIGKYSCLVGLSFYKFDGTHTSYPIAEIGDLAVVSNRRGRKFVGIITDISVTFGGTTTLKCSAESAKRNGMLFLNTTQSSSGSMTSTAQQVVGEYSKTEDLFKKLMAGGYGMYTSTVTLADGGVEIRLHNKESFDNSTFALKTNSAGTFELRRLSAEEDWTVSACVVEDGSALFNILTAKGITADAIRGGTLTIGSGRDDDSVPLTIVGSTGEVIGTWDDSGIKISLPLSDVFLTLQYDEDLTYYSEYMAGGINIFAHGGDIVTNLNAGGLTTTGVSVNDNDFEDAYIKINGEDVFYPQNALNGYASKADATLNKSVPSGTTAPTNITSITLSKGLWLVIIGASWAGNTSGYRALSLSTSASSMLPSRADGIVQQAVNLSTQGNYTQFTKLVNVTANSQTFYINVMQNSGSTLTCYGSYSILKLRG